MEDVGSVGNLSEERDMMRDLRELREIEGEGGATHDQQDRASARRTERDARADESRPRERKRTRRGRLRRCGRSWKPIDMLQLRSDGAFRQIL